MTQRFRSLLSGLSNNKVSSLHRIIQLLSLIKISIPGVHHFVKRKYQLYYIIFYISAPTLIFLASCNGDAKDKQVIPGTHTIRIDLTAATPLAKEEQLRLHNAAAAWYDSALGSRDFNGSMIMAKNGNIVFEVYNGNAHVGSTDLITDSTSFHIASVSKTITAMAVLKLWQDGKIGLDDEFVKHFPSFNYPGVTIRTLLNHRSGLPNYLYFMDQLGWDKKEYVTNEDVLNFLVTRKAEIKNISLPNSRFTYCNTNFVLLALLIEKISGKKYGEYLQETFFKPLGMNHTFVFDIKDEATAIPSYDWRGALIPMNFLDVVYGDKNIYSTPKDLLIWDRALTSGILFTEKTLAEAYAPYSNEKPGIRNYGLGWRMNLLPTGKKMIYHNGWWHGNNAAYIRLIQDTATIIVLGNKYNKGIYHANQLSNLFGNYLSGREDEELEPVKKADTGFNKIPFPPVKHRVVPVIPKSKKAKAIPARKKQGKSNRYLTGTLKFNRGII